MYLTSVVVEEVTGNTDGDANVPEAHVKVPSCVRMVPVILGVA